MKIVTIVSHPYQGSYNAEIVSRIASQFSSSGHEFEIIDLVEDRFNPVMTANDLKQWGQGLFADEQSEAYFDKISAADIVIFPFPIWWGSLPAVLKGFIDKVFLPTKAYHYGPNGELIGNLNGKKAVVITTMETPIEYFNGALGNPVENQFIKNTLTICGIETIGYFEIDKIISASDQQRTNWLNEITSFFEKFL